MSRSSKMSSLRPRGHRGAPRAAATVLALLVVAASSWSPPGGTSIGAARAAAAGAQILHPLLRSWVQGEDPALRLPASLGDPAQLGLLSEPERVGVWVRARDGGLSLAAAGLLPAGPGAPVRHARWTRDQVLAALRDPNLLHLTPAVRCRTSLDSSLVETLTAATHDRSGTPPVYAGLTGARVVVGLVDSGIDLAHGDFRDGSNHTRIAFLWDQTSSGTPPPGYTYGREWTAAQIDAGIAMESDPQGHGTHTAGIAAGDGSATGHGEPAFRYVGVAPGAILIVVKTDLFSDKIADGINYVFGRAEQMGYPAVVNLSLGNQFGPHDGTDDFDVTTNLLSGPGHVIVAAAGNDRGLGLHAEAVVAPADSSTITFVVPPYSAQPFNNNDEVVLDGWYDGGAALAVRVITPNGFVVGPVAPGATAASNTEDGRVEIDNATWSPVNGDENVSIQLIDALALKPPRAGKWTIWVEHLPLDAGKAPAELDLWAWYNSMADVHFVRHVQEEEIVTSPATADSVIAVGAYITKTRWPSIDGHTYRYDPEPARGSITDFSSPGPRRDGAQKPDVAAPGMGIVSALSPAAPQDSVGITPDGEHVLMQGTSMASPHVAGLVALMYQAWGTMSAAEIKQRLIAAARSDGFTGAVPNATWGFGKINSLASTGYPVPVTAIESTAWQDGDRVRARFLLAEAMGSAPLTVWRDGPDRSERVMVGLSTAGRERSFVDSTLSVDGTYRYWLRVEAPGPAQWIGPAELFFRRPAVFQLDAGPNPFTDRALIRWRIPSTASSARLTIHDLTGRTLRTVRLGEDGKRSGLFAWDGSGARGETEPAGIYWIHLRTDEGRTITRKILRLR